MYVVVIALAALFGWHLYQKRAQERARDAKGAPSAAARRARKPRPRKRS